MSDVIHRLNAALSGRYRIERKLGEGGMASVYLADDLKHGRKVAIKVLRADVAAVVGSARFLAEIRTTANLQHPHILPLFDSGEADSFLFYVMPYVEGESLRDRLDHEEQLPVKEAVRIARQLADALDQAHRKGVVHRDIKPANVLLHDGNALLADFGIALAVGAAGGDGLTETGVTLGTPLYMSPEQATGDRPVGPQSDIYSLACMLHEMLLGEPPHTGSTPRAILTEILTGSVETLFSRRPSVPANVDAAVRRGLEKVATDRFATSRDFSAALEDPHFRHDVHAGKGTPGMGWRMASPLPWMIGAILLAVGAGAAAFLLPRSAEHGVSRDLAAGPSVREGGTAIAVLPFRTSGPDLEHLGEGLMDLLSRNLVQSNALVTIDPRTVMKRLREVDPDGDVDVGQASSLAADVGATSVLLGSAVSGGDELRLDAVLYGRDGDPMARGQATGSPGDLFALADELAVSLVRELWTSSAPVPHLDVAAVTTRSPQALRSFLEGERLYRLGDIRRARRSLERSVALDSTFALAHYRLGWALAWTEGLENSNTVAQLRAALRYGERLPPREQALVRGFLMLAEDRLEEGYAALRPYVERWPDDPEAWIVLANHQYHHPEWMGRSTEEVLEPFDRVIALDSSLVMAYVHPLDIALHNRDQLLFDHYMEPLRRRMNIEEVPQIARKARWGVECFGGQGVVEPLPGDERLSGEPTGPPPCVDATDGEAALGGNGRRGRLGSEGRKEVEMAELGPMRGVGNHIHVLYPDAALVLESG